MKAFLKNWVFWFLIINTGITIVVAVSVLKYDAIASGTILRIVISALATSLVTAGFFAINPKKPMGKGMIALSYFLHYLVLYGVMYLLGTSFGWFERSVGGAVSIAISVAIVYAFSVIASTLLSQGEAKELNRALKNFTDNDEGRKTE